MNQLTSNLVVSKLIGWVLRQCKSQAHPSKIFVHLQSAKATEEFIQLIVYLLIKI